MRKSSKIQVIILVFIAGLVGYYFGVNKVNFEWKKYQPKISVTSKSPPPEMRNADFAQFWTVWQKLESDYYDKEKLDPKKMVNGAIQGMVNSLGDPFTVYLPPVQNDNFKAGLAGQFQGIGAELGQKDNQVIIISPITGSPAEKAGLRAGDYIYAVDGKSIANWTINQAVEKIRGPKGTSVTLTVGQKDKEPKDVKIVRDVITVKSLEASIKKVKDLKGIKLDKSLDDQEVIYARLSQFGDNTNDEWLNAINQVSIQMNTDKNVRGVIFDLRNNPGGYLTDAVFIASEFLKEGQTVVMQEENGQRTELKTNRKGLLTEMPVVILINKGSASASEIVTGALRDYNRAKVIGDTSFGKGTIQQAEDLGGGAGLHVTIAKWLTPNGTWVHEKGIEPDIKVSLDSKQPERDLQLEKAVQELLQ